MDRSGFEPEASTILVFSMFLLKPFSKKLNAKVAILSARTPACVSFLAERAPLIYRPMLLPLL